jgi:hypothetical protein
MAKKASANNSGKTAKKSASKAVARVSSGGGRSGKEERFDASEAFVKLLQSPIVAELVAVAATAALASLAEHGISSGGGGSRGKRAGKAVKEAGKAAAAAVGRRLGNEFDEIRKAADATKTGAKA